MESGRAETRDDPLAAKFIPRLKPVLDGCARAIASFDAAVKASENGWKLIDAEKANWLRACGEDYADILPSIFEDDKRTTDSFFKRPPKSKKPPKQPTEKQG